MEKMRENDNVKHVILVVYCELFSLRGAQWCGVCVCECVCGMHVCTTAYVALLSPSANKWFVVIEPFVHRAVFLLVQFHLNGL